MLQLLSRLAATGLLAVASLAQSWVQLPMPPGVTTINLADSRYGGEHPLLLRNALWEFRNGAWNVVPQPAGVTLGSFGAYLVPCGPRPLCCSNVYTQLQEWDGSNWNPIPMPPGGVHAHPAGGDVYMLEGGARHLAARPSNGSLYEWDGTSWLPLPLPPGEVVVPSATANAIGGSSDRHTFWINNGTAVVEWDGTSWVPVPLPPGVTDIRNDIQPSWLPLPDIPRGGRCGAHLTVRKDNSTLWLRRNGTWETQAMPPGVTLNPSNVFRSGRSMLVVYLPQAIWALPTPTRDGWKEVPLPPGVNSDVQDHLAYGASRPLALTNGGSNLWELRGTTWSALPLPTGMTAIGMSTFSGLLPGGQRPLVARPFYLALEEWNGTSWSPLPLPPGAPYVGGFSGCQIHDCGARPLASTGYGTSLHEWNGGQWVPLPMPPGVAQVHPLAGVVAIPGHAERHTLSTGFGTGIVEWNGTQWQSIPLPPGVTDLGNEGLVQPLASSPYVDTVGRAGGLLTVSTAGGTQLLQWVDGRWQELRFPPTKSLAPATGNVIAPGCRAGALLATDGGSKLWLRPNRLQDVEATSTCAGTSALIVAGEPSLGGSLTLTVGAPAPTWFTGFAVDSPIQLPTCGCPALANAVWVYGPYVLSIPNDAVFLGAELYAQGLDFVSGPTTCVLPPPAALTDVLRFVIG